MTRYRAWQLRTARRELETAARYLTLALDETVDQRDAALRCHHADGLARLAAQRASRAGGAFGGEQAS